MTARALAPQQSERNFDRALVEYATLNGWKTAHFNDARRQVKRGSEYIWIGDGDAKGWPDRVFVRRDVMVIVETKRKGGKLTPEQTAWLDALVVVAEAAPEHVKVRVWSPASWADIEWTLGRRDG